MSDLLIWVTFEVIFGYLFYITGVVILRIVSLGRSRAEFHSFKSYRDLTNTKGRTSSQAYYIGLLFYALLLFFIVVYYSKFT